MSNVIYANNTFNFDSLGTSLIVQQNQEFSIQNEDLPPLPSSTRSIQVMHNVQFGSFNMANMGVTNPSRNTTLSSIPSSGIQLPSGNVTNGRSGTSNVPIPRSQMFHGSSQGHSVVMNRGVIGIPGSPGYSSNTNSAGGSIPGNLPTYASTATRSSTPGLGVSPMLGNAGYRIHSSMGNMAGRANIERSIISAGGLSTPGPGLRSNSIGSGGIGSSSGQPQNQLLGGVLQQASPQVMSMSRNSYPGGGQLPQSQISLNSMGMLGDVNNNESSPFDFNDFPPLSGRPTSVRGARGPKGSLRKHSKGPIVQQNQELSIQNEDFKGGNADYSMDSHKNEQLQENATSMMQSQQQNQNVKCMPLTQSTPEPFSLHSLSSDIRLIDRTLIGMDLTTLGRNWNSKENVYKTFGGPFSYKPLSRDPDFSVPQCYSVKPLTLQCGYFSKFSLDTLFYIFYSMPKDEAQLYAANELCNRGWFYRKDYGLWFARVPNTEPLVKSNTSCSCNGRSYQCFDPATFHIIRKDNFVVHYEM